MYTAPLFDRYKGGSPLAMEIQIAKGYLCCPKTRVPLVKSSDGRSLESADKTIRYPIINKIPVFMDRLSSDAARSQMTDEYQEFEKSEKSWYQLKIQIMKMFNATWQSSQSMAAHHRTYQIPEDGICLAIGGGPTRSHPKTFNLNIDRFANVDIVGDAHALPYVDNSIDSIVCEDALEHIKDPKQVVAEMFRVLKKGGIVYSVVPFLISYHGYPSHFQNFTCQGDTELYLSAGIEVLDSGV